MRDFNETVQGVIGEKLGRCLCSQRFQVFKKVAFLSLGIRFNSEYPNFFWYLNLVLIPAGGGRFYITIFDSDDQLLFWGNRGFLVSNDLKYGTYENICVSAIHNKPFDLRFTEERDRAVSFVIEKFQDHIIGLFKAKWRQSEVSRDFILKYSHLDHIFDFIIRNRDYVLDLKKEKISSVEGLLKFNDDNYENHKRSIDIFHELCPYGVVGAYFIDQLLGFFVYKDGISITNRVVVNYLTSLVYGLDQDFFTWHKKNFLLASQIEWEKKGLCSLFRLDIFKRKIRVGCE